MNHSIFISVSVFSTAVPIGDTVNKETNVINQQKLVKFPTGRRQTSWLFTKCAGVEFRAAEEKSIQWQGGELEPDLRLRLNLIQL